MLFTIHELEAHPIDFEEGFAPGAIDLGSELTQRSPIETSGRAQLVEEHHGKHKRIKDIRLSGELSTSLDVACARCLEPVQHEIRRKFDLLYRPLGADAGQDERAVPSAE